MENGDVHPVSHVEAVKARLRPLQERAERARNRFRDHPPGRWHFAIVGGRFDPHYGVSVGDVGQLDEVVEPPGEVALANVLANRSLFGIVGRWSPGITYELVLSSEFDSLEFALRMGWNLIAALRLRSDAEFVVPAVADHSWSTIEGAASQSVNIQMLEDVPHARSLSEVPGTIDSTIADWVAMHHIKVLELRAITRFHFALASLSSSHTTTDIRLIVTSLWAGLEALVGVNQEISFRMSALLACMLTDPGIERVQLYHHIRNLYKGRSKAVHGVDMSDRDLRDHAIQTRALLRRCLLRIVEIGAVPSTSELEGLLLGVSLSAQP